MDLVKTMEIQARAMGVVANELLDSQPDTAEGAKVTLKPAAAS